MEKERIEKVYQHYQNSNQKEKDWGNSSTKELVWKNLLSAIEKHLQGSGLSDKKIKLLEVGSSAGGVLKRTSPIFPKADFTGMDIRFSPLSDGKHYRPYFNFVCANGTNMPFHDNYFDIVLQSVCLSSVLDINTRKLIYQEIFRVLKPGGIFFSYDMRYWSPNPNVTAISKTELQKSFPDNAGLTFYPLTLAPPLERLFSSVFIYNILNALPFLRSHWLCCVKKGN